MLAHFNLEMNQHAFFMRQKQPNDEDKSKTVAFKRQLVYARSGPNVIMQVNHASIFGVVSFTKKSMTRKTSCCVTPQIAVR